MIPQHGYLYLANEVRRSKRFDRAEVHAAFQGYHEAAELAHKTGDWDTWAKHFTEDAIYVEHRHGIMRGRAAIRRWITSSTRGRFPHLEFPEFYVIDNDLVFRYCTHRSPGRDGGPGHQFVSASILCYAGDNKWCYQEDVDNAEEFERMYSLSATEHSGACTRRVAGAR